MSGPEKEMNKCIRSTKDEQQDPKEAPKRKQEAQGTSKMERKGHGPQDGATTVSSKQTSYKQGQQASIIRP